MAAPGSANRYFTDDELKKLAEGGLTQEEVDSLDDDEIRRLGELHTQDPLSGRPSLAEFERKKEIERTPTMGPAKPSRPGPPLDEGPKDIGSFLASIGQAVQGQGRSPESDDAANFKTQRWEALVKRAQNEPETMEGAKTLGEKLRAAQDKLIGAHQLPALLSGPRQTDPEENAAIAKVATIALQEGVTSMAEFVSHPMTQLAERPGEFGMNLLTAALEIGPAVKAVRGLGVPKMASVATEARVTPTRRLAFDREFNTRFDDAVQELRANEKNMTPEQYRAANDRLDGMVRGRLRERFSEPVEEGYAATRAEDATSVVDEAVAGTKSSEAEAELDRKLSDARHKRPPLPRYGEQPRSAEELAAAATATKEGMAREAIVSATPSEVRAANEILETKLDDIASLKELNREMGGDPAVTAQLRALESHISGTQATIVETREAAGVVESRFERGDSVVTKSGEPYSVVSVDGNTVTVRDALGENEQRFHADALEHSFDEMSLEQKQGFANALREGMNRPSIETSAEDLAKIKANTAVPGHEYVPPPKAAPPKGTKVTTEDGITYEYVGEQQRKGKEPLRYWKADRDMIEGKGKAGSQITEDSIRASGFKVPGEEPAATGKSLGPAEIDKYSKMVSEKGKPFDEQKYKTAINVRVTFSDGTTHIDSVKGLNEGHALARAAGNWPSAVRVESMGVDSVAEISASTDMATAKVKMQDVLSVSPMGGILLAGIAKDDQSDPTPRQGHPLSMKHALWAVPAGILAYGVGRYFASPSFRTALARFTRLDKTGPADLERVFEEALSPLFPNRPANGLGDMAPYLGPAAGAALGAAVGSQVGQDEPSLGGAAFGLLTGGIAGAYAGTNLAKQFRTSLTYRQLYKMYFTEAAGMSASAVEAKQLTRMSLEGRIREIKDTAQALDKLDPVTLGTVQSWMSGNTNIAQVPMAAREAARMARQLFDNLSMDLLKSGLVKDKILRDTIKTNIGTYVPRLLLRYELDDPREIVEGWLRSQGKGWGYISSKNYTKARKDIHPNVLKALGEITDNPGYLLAKRGVITAADIEQARYHRFLLASPEDALPAKLVRQQRMIDKVQRKMRVGEEGVLAKPYHIWRGRGELLTEPQRIKFYKGESGMEAAEWQGRTYWKMPDNPRYGLVKNQFIEQAVASDIISTHETTKGLEKLFDTGTSIFKFFKAVFNPASQFRNNVANAIFADIEAGIPTWRMDKWGRGLHDLNAETKLYKQAVRDGAFGGEFTATEIGNLLLPKIKNESSFMEVAANTAVDLANKPTEVFTKWHAGSEAWARMTVYRHAVENLGMDGPAAAKFARRTIPDYQDVPRWVKMVRKSPFGAPFISFSYKALPRTLEAAVAFGDPKKMMRFWKYPLAMAALNEYSAQKNGLLGKGEEKDIFGTLRRMTIRTMTAGAYTPDSYDTFRKYLPNHVGGMQIAIPWRDQYDRQQYLDGTYFLPWGDAGEMGKGDIATRSQIPFLPRQLEPSNPWFQLGVAASTGKDSFTGRDIVPAGAVGSEALMAQAQFLMRAWGPSLLNPAGYSAESLGRSFSGQFEENPNVKSRTTAVASEVLGARTRPVEPRTDYRFKYYEMKKDLDANMGEIRRLVPKLAQKEDLSTQDMAVYLKDHPTGAAARAIRRRLEIVSRFLKKFPPDELPPTPEAFLKKIQDQYKH